MAQLIKFPVRNTERQGLQTAVMDEEGKPGNTSSATVLFFTGVRYERVNTDPQPDHFLSPAGRGGCA